MTIVSNYPTNSGLTKLKHPTKGTVPSDTYTDVDVQKHCKEGMHRINTLYILTRTLLSGSQLSNRKPFQP